MVNCEPTLTWPFLCGLMASDCLRMRMMAYSEIRQLIINEKLICLLKYLINIQFELPTKAPNTKRIHDNIQASIAVRPERKILITDIFLHSKSPGWQTRDIPLGRFSIGVNCGDLKNWMHNSIEHSNYY